MDALIEAADAMLRWPGYIAENPGLTEGMLCRLGIAADDPARPEKVQAQARERLAAIERARQPAIVPRGG